MSRIRRPEVSQQLWTSTDGTASRRRTIEKSGCDRTNFQPGRVGLPYGGIMIRHLVHWVLLPFSQKHYTAWLADWRRHFVALLYPLFDLGLLALVAAGICAAFQEISFSIGALFWGCVCFSLWWTRRMIPFQHFQFPVAKLRNLQIFREFLRDGYHLTPETFLAYHVAIVPFLRTICFLDGEEQGDGLFEELLSSRAGQDHEEILMAIVDSPANALEPGVTDRTVARFVKWMKRSAVAAIGMT